MYEDFYGRSGSPFQLSPDPPFYFGSKGHEGAYSFLKYGVYQGEGFLVITGEVGAGKTTLVRALLEHLDPNSSSPRRSSALSWKRTTCCARWPPPSGSRSITKTRPREDSWPALMAAERAEGIRMKSEDPRLARRSFQLAHRTPLSERRIHVSQPWTKNGRHATPARLCARGRRLVPRSGQQFPAMLRLRIDSAVSARRGNCSLVSEQSSVIASTGVNSSRCRGARIPQ